MENDTIILPYVSSQSQEVDVPTKAKSKHKFDSFVRKLRMIDIYSPI